LEAGRKKFGKESRYHVCPKCGSEDVFPSDDGGWDLPRRPMREHDPYDDDD